MKKFLLSLVGLLALTSVSFAVSIEAQEKKNQLLPLINLILNSNEYSDSQKSLVKSVISNCATSNKNEVIKGACSLISEELKEKSETSTPIKNETLIKEGESSANAVSRLWKEWYCEEDDVCHECIKKGFHFHLENNTCTDWKGNLWKTSTYLHSREKYTNEEYYFFCRKNPLQSVDACIQNLLAKQAKEKVEAEQNNTKK